MEYRAKEFVDPNGLHLKTLTLFTDDADVTYAISDGENRIRDLYKNYYVVFNRAYVEIPWPKSGCSGRVFLPLVV